MSTKLENLLPLFSQAYIIGGSPCSGKSTIAERLTKEYDLHYYNADAHVALHMQQCNPVEQPVMYHYSKLSWNEMWLKPVEVQVREEIIFYRELSSFIIEDLLEIGNCRQVIMEGAAFLPELMDSWRIDHHRVLFLIPTPKFQISHYLKRAWIQPILDACDDPGFAFNQWMKRDELFGKEVINQAKYRGLGVIEVDGTVSIEAQYQIVCLKFGLDNIHKS